MLRRSDIEGLETQLQEVRRGTVVLACLQLLRTAEYGYKLLEDLARCGFTAEANTLYPLLRRLDKQGYLTSEWNTQEVRPRKFYRTSANGVQLAEAIEANVEQGEVPEAAESAVQTEPGDPGILAAGYADGPMHLIGPRNYLTWVRWSVDALNEPQQDGASRHELLPSFVFLCASAGHLHSPWQTPPWRLSLSAWA